MTADKKKMKVWIVLILLLLISGCSAGGNQGEAENDVSDTEVSENLTAVQSEVNEDQTADLPEETEESILSSIEGVWKAGEYIGFIPFEIYENGMWDENAGTEEERMAAYEEEKERAAAVLPDFYFEIRENDAEQYIYVTNENRTYASPVNIVVSDKAADDEYSLFVHRTVEGLDLSEEYPLTYIEFNSFVYSEEENKIIYEPATLILTADGQFLLLKEGAFYSLEHSIQIEIMSGDFSSMTEFRETVEQQYQWWEESGAIENMEWRLVDLNGDGIDDLILQDIQIELRPIVAIFALKEDSASCELWDLNDSTAFSFCGPSGELMYTAPYSGTEIAGEPYWHYYYDSEWNKIEDFALMRTVVDSSMAGSREEFLQQYQESIEANPDIAEDGDYYYRYEIDKESGEWKERESLSYEQFNEIFEDVMGMDYFNLLGY